MDNDKFRGFMDSLNYSTANPLLKGHIGSLSGMNILMMGTRAARTAPHGYVKRGKPDGKAVVQPLCAVSMKVGMDTLTFCNTSDDEIVIKVTRRRAKRSPKDKG